METKGKKACSLLETTGLNVEEIIELVGYTNVHFFYELFGRSMHMTPAEYRARHQWVSGSPNGAH